MRSRGRKIIKKIFIILPCLLISILVLNWILTYRLERYLKLELSNMVSRATDGFYDFTFSELKIDFFSGELLIEGIDFHPNIKEYNRLSANDSLPEMRMGISLDFIHFKGINLTWRRNYKKLHFELFEMKNVIFDMYDNQSLPTKSVSEFTIDKKHTLYDLISSYISVLSANKINLHNVSVAYHIEGTSNPTKYSLANIDLNFYDFRLDKNSYSSGKLLYSDNFEFIADRPQVVLSNKQFELKTKNILLNTQDSIILFEGIHFYPQSSLLIDTIVSSVSYADIMVEKLRIGGVSFKRINTLNYLNTSSFDIIDSQIKYFNAGNTTLREEKNDRSKIGFERDSLMQAWSLYSLVSPVLREVTIDRINIDSADLNYSKQVGNKIDYFTMNRFKLEANRFKIDSVSNSKSELLYSDNFSISGSSLKGKINSENHEVGIGRLSIHIDSLRSDYHFDSMSIKPINKNAFQNYINADINELNIIGFKYDKALEINRLQLKRPVIKFYKSGYQPKDSSQGDKSINEILSSYFKYLLINNIDLINGDVSYIDLNNANSVSMENLYLHTSEFLLNKVIINNPLSLINKSNLSFSFKNLHTLFHDKQYRLKASDVRFIKKSGLFELKNFNLKSQKDKLGDYTDTYYDIAIPQTTLFGLNYEKNLNKNALSVDSFNIHSPKIKIRKNKEEAKNVDKPNQIFIDIFNARSFYLDGADFSYINSSNKDSLKVLFGDTRINNLTIKPSNYLFDRFLLSNTNIYFYKKNNTINFNTEQLSVNLLDWKKYNYLKIGDFELYKPNINYTTNATNVQSHSNLSLKKESNNTSIYQSINSFAKVIDIGRLNLMDACFNYVHSGDTVRELNDLNKTNLLLTRLSIEPNKETFLINDLDFQTKNLEFPISRGFYKLKIGDLTISKRDSSFNLNNLYFRSNYPKTEFAYKHPQHKDWFDFTVRHISLSGVNIPFYLSNRILDVRRLEVLYAELKNYKNQNIYTPSRISPPIYSHLHNLPFKFNIESVEVKNFGVIYEELTKNSTEPGKIFFTDMNGYFSKFTNIATFHDQYNVLRANGKLMGNGYFEATWMLPVSSNFDRFEIEARMQPFEFKELNRLISPMAPVRVPSGTLDKLVFNTVADSVGAWIDMKLLYHDLRIEILKKQDGQLSQSRFVTSLVNRILKSNNPNKPNKKARESSLSIIRDPYHSTFNYMWQILQPSVVESVGVSHRKQKLAKKVTNLLGDVKSFFTFSWLKSNKNIKESKDED